MQWYCKKFEELTNYELYEILKLRVDVFVVEQVCPYPDLDNKDKHPEVFHLLGYQQDRLVAYSRLLPQGVSFDTVSIGRVAVDQSVRGSGLGHELLTVSIEHVRRLWGGQVMTIGAQSHLKAFYQQHGFVQVSEEYLEDDIPHINMQYQQQ